MGEVYRARDTTLHRDVAIKVLPESFVSDPDRLARFIREAQALAALNHPNIAQIYDASAGAYIVMELVDGQDLSDLIDRGHPEAESVSRGLPLAEALPIARQIAEGLEAAHEQGIVHRDLKPANIKVRPDGTVKILDFGLAKAVGPDSANSSHQAMNSPTLTNRATQMGVILGTAAYMSPEQAKGKPVDKRADIWAFGVVFYEMLSGRRAFEGDDVSTTLAAVLMRDPEWVALPADTPPAISTLVRRCLDRDPRQRLRDIGEARRLLSNPDALRADESRVTSSSPAAPVSRAPWIVAAAAAVIAAVFGWLWWSSASAATAGTRLEASLAPPEGHFVNVAFALSPDGTRLVMEALNEKTGAISLWVRDLASGAPTKLAGTDGALQPFWSPNGQEIAFFADGKLKKTDLQGAPPQVICDAPNARGGAWGPDGTIVFAGTFRTGLEKVSAASGSKPSVLTTPDEARKEKSHRWPVFLPDGKHLLFVAQTSEAGAKDDDSTIEALDLRTGVRTRLVTANSSPLYSPEGFLLFWREGALRAQAFDAASLQVSGSVFAVASGVAFDTNEFASATVAANGTLLYLASTGLSLSKLLEVDRAGRPTKTIAESVIVEGGIALSHDNTRLAVGLTAAGARDTDVWVYDLARGTSGPLTFEVAGEHDPVWSLDDTELYYANDNKNDGIIFRRFADGRGQATEVGSNVSGMWMQDISPDRTWLLVNSVTATTALDIFRFDIATKKLTPIVNGPAQDFAGRLSPNGRWLAYASDDSGRTEIYLRSMGPDAGKWGVTSSGGSQPTWRRDGREVYYLGPQGQVMAVEVDPEPPFRTSTPKELFRAKLRPSMSMPYAPFSDGKKFIIDVLPEGDRALMTIVTNWTAAKR